MAASKVHFKLTQDEDGYPPVAVESCWATATESPAQYEVDSIPFFSRDATLGDVVAVREEDGVPWFDHVVSRSRNSLVRVIFFEASCLPEVTNSLQSFGCSTEYSGAHSILSVNIPSEVDLALVQSYLSTQHTAGHIDYEEAILRQ